MSKPYKIKGKGESEGIIGAYVRSVQDGLRLAPLVTDLLTDVFGTSQVYNWEIQEQEEFDVLYVSTTIAAVEGLRPEFLQKLWDAGLKRLRVEDVNGGRRRYFYAGGPPEGTWEKRR